MKYTTSVFFWVRIELKKRKKTIWFLQLRTFPLGDIRSFILQASVEIDGYQLSISERSSMYSSCGHLVVLSEPKRLKKGGTYLILKDY